MGAPASPPLKTVPHSEPFTYRRPIRWGDTDAAGIVFTAHYFDICMEVIESWFRDALGLDWYAMTLDQRIGTPFVHAGIDFHAPLTPRDTLSIRVEITRLGSSSLGLALHGHRDSDAKRAFTGKFTCCFSDLGNLTPIPIPDRTRHLMADYQRRQTPASVPV